MTLLDVRGLRLATATASLVDGVDLRLGRGECLAIVGESGAGKSLTAKSLLGLLPSGVEMSAQRFEIGGVDARDLSPRAWGRLRGSKIALVSQDALVSLDPLRRIGAEVGEPIQVHEPSVRGAMLRERVTGMLRAVAMPEPEVRASSYPHELSGGLRQRALIASALAAHPTVLVADEPTTALDATVQAHVLGLLRRIADDGVGVVFISHDMRAVARVADRILVMKEGRIVEAGPAARILSMPAEAYTKSLVAATRHVPLSRKDEGSQRLFVAEGLSKTFGRRAAVDDVSFTLSRGRTIAVVGESGSGKTTLARMIVGVERPDRGSMSFQGKTWDAKLARGAARTRVQLVSQSPTGTLDPRWSIGRTLAEALGASGLPRARRAERITELLREVGLEPGLRSRRPAQLSGGQRQRVAIARALAVDPALLVLDEPVSALDVTVRERVLDRLRAIQDDRGLAMVFVTHDLDVVAGIADDVLVMAHGRIVEEGPVSRVFESPRHPFTRELLDAARPAVDHGGRPHA